MPEQCLRWPCTICEAEPLPGEVEQCTGKTKFMYPRNLDFRCKSVSDLLCTLRIDKLRIFLYNKARNQRSTAELTPLTLSRKERDRWLIWNPHSSDRLSGFAEKQNRGSPQTGCFPRITKQIKEPVLSIKNAKTVQSVRINPLAIQIDPPEVISHDEDSYTDAPV